MRHFALLCLLLPGLALAHDVSFAEARTLAQAAAPDVQLAVLRAALSKTEVEVAGALSNPTLSVSTATQTARLGTSLGVPLALFGQRATSIRAAQADADAVALDVKAVTGAAKWAATLAWIDLWESQERARLLDLAATDAARLAQIATQRFDAGTGPRLDTVRTRADRARARAEADAAAQLVTAAAERLAPSLGAPVGAGLFAVGAPGFAAVLPPLEGLQDAVAKHPVLQRDRAEVAAAQRHLESERRQRWPTLTPQLSLNQFDPTLPAPDVILGLSFEVPVLSLRGGAIARATAQRTLTEVAESTEARRLNAELLDAWRRTEAAGARLRALQDQVLPAMKEARDMTEEGYQSGRIDLLRLLDAQRAWLDSRLSEAEAGAARARAAADLERAAGADLEGPKNAP